MPGESPPRELISWSRGYQENRQHVISCSGGGGRRIVIDLISWSGVPAGHNLMLVKTLYSNRSAAHLAAKHPHAALRNAHHALSIDPNWARSWV